MNKYDIGSAVIYMSQQVGQQVNISLMFHENQNSIQNIQPNQCVIVIKENVNADVQLIVQQVVEFLKSRGISVVNNEVNIIIMDQNDRLKIQGVVNNENLKYVIKDSSVNQNVVSSQEKAEMPFEKFWKANVIQKMDNGILKNYIHRIGDGNTVDYMLENISLDDMYNEFKRLSSDVEFRNRVNGMNEGQIANVILDYIATSRNLTKYPMESASEIKNDTNNQKENIVSSLAASNEGVANKEIGVVNNNHQNNNYQVVEENTNGNLKVGSPDVVSNNSYSSGSVTEEVSNNNVYSASSDGNEAYNYDTASNLQFNQWNQNSYSRDMLQTGLSNNKVRTRVRKPMFGVPSNSGFISVVAYVIFTAVILAVIGFIIFR